MNFRVLIPVFLFPFAMNVGFIDASKEASLGPDPPSGGSEAHSLEEDSQPRFLKDVFSSFFYSSPKFIPTKREIENVVVEMCHSIGGKRLDEECLEFVDSRKTFDEARKVCLQKGGDLYIPKQHEMLLFSKYFLYFRKAFKLDSTSLGWVGARRMGPGAPVVTVFGDDVTRDAIYNIFTITKFQCVNIHLNYGTAFLKGEECDKELPFTCEYVFDTDIRHITTNPSKQNFAKWLNMFKMF